MPRYTFDINGHRHNFDGPDFATTQRFAKQWAAEQMRPTFGSMAHQFVGGVGDYVNQTLDDLSKAPNDLQGGEGDQAAALGDVLHPRGAATRAAVTAAQNAFQPQIPSIAQPRNKPELFARFAGSVAPNAFGGGGLVRRAIRILAPAAMSEAARRATQALGGDRFAQSIASSAAGFVGSGLSGLKLRAPAARAGIIEPPSEPPTAEVAPPPAEAAHPAAGGSPTGNHTEATAPDSASDLTTGAAPTSNVISLGDARRSRPSEGANGRQSGSAGSPQGGATVTAFPRRGQNEASVEGSGPALFNHQSPGPAMDHGAAARALMDEGVGLTKGQLAGGPALLSEDQALALPSTGPTLRRARVSGQTDLNRALANRALASIGETIPTNVKLGEDTIDHIQARLDDTEAAAREGLYLIPDKRYFQNQMKMLTDAYDNHTEDSFRRLDSIANNVQLRLNDNDYGYADAKNIFDYLDDLSWKYLANSVPEHNYVGRQIQNMKGEVGALATRRSPEYAALSSAVDQGRSNLALLRAANAQSSSVRGGFSVANLVAAYADKVADPSSDVAALGGQDMFNLVNNADTVMGSNIPPPFKSAKQGVVPPAGAGADESPVVPAGDANAFKVTDPSAASSLIPQTNALQPTAAPASIISLASRRPANQQAVTPPPDGPKTD